MPDDTWVKREDVKVGSPVEAGTDQLAVGRTDHSLVNGM